MSLKTQHEFLFLGRDEGDSFVENYAYDLGENGERSGKIFLNIEIQNNPAEAEQIAEVIFDTMRKSFFSDLEKDPYLRFEDALKEVNAVLNAMREEKVSKYIGNLHVILAAIVENNLYVSQCGDAEAYLIRKRYTSIISEGLYDPNAKDFFSNIASGELEPADLVLLCSTRLLRYISRTDLAKIMGSKNLIAILAELKDYLSAEVLVRMGFIGIYALSGAPHLSPQEEGKVMEHLHKEEDFEHDGVHEHKTVNTSFAHISQKVSRVFTSATDRLRSLGGGRTQNDYSGGGSGFGSWSKQNILVALVAVVLVLFLGLWWAKARIDEQQHIADLTAKLDQAEQKINNAESSQGVNASQAQMLLTQAQDIIKEVSDQGFKGFNRQMTNKLLGRITRLRDQFDKIDRPEPKVLADLATKRANVAAMGVLALKDVLYAYEYNALYPILLDQLKDHQKFYEDESIIAATPFEENNSLLFFTKNNKVVEYRDDRFQLLPTDDTSYHKGVAVQTYGSRSFYILSPGENQIWKYSKLRDRFNKPEEYNVDADLKNAISFAIDSNIYVLNKDGSILKLLTGKKQSLTIDGNPSKELKHPTKIFTLPDMERLYILEPGENRILAYTKEDDSLVFSAQYIFDDLPGLKDFWVDQNEKNLYLLDDEKVYKVGLASQT